MIIVDTNILSELMFSNPDPRVVEWMDSVNAELLWTTSVSVYEINYGIELLPEGKKRNSLTKNFEEMLRIDYRNRIIEFDTNAALAASELGASERKTGRNSDVRDLQIAGIALTRGACIATRNTKDFQFEDLQIINPYALSDIAND